MKVPSTTQTERAGVRIVETAVHDELGWLFREQPMFDLGIDAHIEVVDNGESHGRLLAVQIKAGARYLKEQTEDGYVFRPEPKHVDYWLRHSLPVVVVLVDTKHTSAWWQNVSHQTIESTGKGWKIIVPYSQRLTATAAGELSALADTDPYTLKLRNLESMASWMQLLQDGGRVILEVEEWINKTSGRASLRLTGWDADDVKIGSVDWPFLIIPFANYSVELPRLFPWAQLSVDDNSDFLDYEAECGVWDKEEGRILTYTEDYEDWRRARAVDGLRAHSHDGEVAWWRVNVELGTVGQAFLTLDDLLAAEQTSLAPLDAHP